MKVTVKPYRRTGKVSIPSSKSQMHRLLITAALSSRPSYIEFDGLSNDIAATIDCLNALGADIRLNDSNTVYVRPVTRVPDDLCHLYCKESGSTLRFMLPVVGMLGARAVFHMEGRLPQRPLAPLDALLTEHGMTLQPEEGGLLYCSGQLTGGNFSVPGNISSQYISGLLMALPHLEEDSDLQITGTVESKAYITMTEDVLRIGEIRLEKSGNDYHIPGSQKGSMPEYNKAEGDYSNAAFFLCIGALSKEGVLVEGLNPDSSQGDKAVLDILKNFGAEVTAKEEGIFVRGGNLRGITIDAAPIPDLIPVLSVVASAAAGTTEVIHAGRLRLKESDRLTSTTQTLLTLGADIRELEEGLIIQGKASLDGGCISSFGDHRIAMSAAVASCVCTKDVVIQGSECTNKSYPRFWEDFGDLEAEA